MHISGFVSYIKKGNTILISLKKINVSLLSAAMQYVNIQLAVCENINNFYFTILCPNIETRCLLPSGHE